jgi:hypothetical protein
MQTIKPRARWVPPRSDSIKIEKGFWIVRGDILVVTDHQLDVAIRKWYESQISISLYRKPNHYARVQVTGI